MPYFVAFLFSPFGCVGRSAWWMTKLVYPLILVVALVYLIFPLFFDPHAQELLKHYRTSQSHDDAVQFQAYLYDQAATFTNRTWAVVALIVLIYWSTLAIEIKRWHDRAMSGFWVLLDFVPLAIHHFQGHPLTGNEYIFVVCLWIFQLIQLGFLGTVLDRSPIGGKGQSVQPGPTQGITSTFLTVILVLLLAGIAGFAGIGYFSQRHTALDASSNGGQGDTFVHGTSDTNFATDWLVLHGKKIEGITSAKPASDGNVVILYSDGVLHVPASSLPQGFLDAWKIKVHASDVPPDDAK